jgi:hypothetical protein
MTLVLALRLPGAARGKTLMTFGKAPDQVVLRAPLDAVDMPLLSDPDCFFQIPHYAGRSAVLVRPACADTDKVAGLASMAQRKAQAL